MEIDIKNLSDRSLENEIKTASKKIDEVIKIDNLDFVPLWKSLTEKVLLLKEEQQRRKNIKKDWCDFKDIDPDKFYGLEIIEEIFNDIVGEKYIFTRGCKGAYFVAPKKQLNNFYNAEDLFNGNGKKGVIKKYRIRTFDTEKKLMLWIAGIRPLNAYELKSCEKYHIVYDNKKLYIDKEDS